MAGPLAHSPAEILARALIDMGLGAASGAWTVKATDEPDAPDEVITTYDTAGRDNGRTQTDGERQGPEGFQVRVRARTHSVGYPKARAIAIALDSVVDRIVSLTNPAAVYYVQAISRTGGVLALGKMDFGASRRNVFTLNGLAFVRQLS